MPVIEKHVSTHSNAESQKVSQYELLSNNDKQFRLFLGANAEVFSDPFWQSPLGKELVVCHYETIKSLSENIDDLNLPQFRLDYYNKFLEISSKLENLPISPNIKFEKSSKIMTARKKIESCLKELRFERTTSSDLKRNRDEIQYLKFSFPEYLAIIRIALGGKCGKNSLHNYKGKLYAHPASDEMPISVRLSGYVSTVSRLTIDDLTGKGHLQIKWEKGVDGVSKKIYLYDKTPHGHLELSLITSEITAKEGVNLHLYLEETQMQFTKDTKFII